MNTKIAIDMMDYAVQMARLPQCANTSPFRIANGLAKLRRLGREAHTHAESMCNFGERTEGADVRKRNSISTRASQVIANMSIPLREAGVQVEVHGDPRGSCLQIHIKCESGLGLSLRF